MKAICGRQLLDTTLILFSAGYGKPALTKMDEFLVFNEIGININEALSELDSFLNQKSNDKKLKFIPDNRNESSNFLKKINSENLFNSSKMLYF